jgi:hypothetical protein
MRFGINLPGPFWVSFGGRRHYRRRRTTRHARPGRGNQYVSPRVAIIWWSVIAAFVLYIIIFLAVQ